MFFFFHALMKLLVNSFTTAQGDFIHPWSITEAGTRLFRFSVKF